MALLTAAELKRIEKKHSEGVGSAVVVDLFRQKGERFSEATLRKYVQLGLLPKSRRVGSRGRHRGSRGSYPVAIVRMINEIKKALAQGATLEEIRISKVGLVGEVDALKRTLDEVMRRFDEALEQQERGKRAKLKKTLQRHRQGLTKQTRELSKFATKLGAGG